VIQKREHYKNSAQKNAAEAWLYGIAATWTERKIRMASKATVSMRVRCAT
jgi:hypothetical protein